MGSGGHAAHLFVIRTGKNTHLYVGMDESNLSESQEPRIKIIGKPGCALAYKIRDFLHRSDVPFEWIPVSDDEQARKEAGVDHANDSRLPMCIFPDGTRLECPTIRQIVEK